MPGRRKAPTKVRPLLDRAHLGATALLAWAFVVAACSGASPDSPFSGAEGGSGGATASGGGGGEGGLVGIDPTIGGPCVDDGQCDDEVDCTMDRCDLEIERCRHTPDDSVCQNGVFCDGMEVCAIQLGCRAGQPVDCGDFDACTVDACIEATQSCTSEPRDADFDGDPDNKCGGGDCNDLDPAISSLSPEICANGVDDNCSGTTDEAGCSAPEHDTCLDPLVIDTSGLYAMSTAGASADYPTACPIDQPTAGPDVVAAVTLPPGQLVDIAVTARTTSIPVSVAIAGQCGDPASELSCGSAFASAAGGQVAKLRARGVGSMTDATAYPIYVTTASATDLTLDVQIEPATAAPTNETCGTAAPLPLGVPVTVPILDAADNIATACAHETGDLVYSFVLDQPSDVDLFAWSIDGDGVPSISLRDEACALPEDEITCQTISTPHIFRHSMPAGTYYVAVAASAPTDVAVAVTTSAPTPLPDDELCATAPPLAANQTVPLTMGNHQDDIDLGCFAGGADAAYTLTLTEPSDVLLVQRYSSGDSASVQLSTPGCSDAADLISCGLGAPTPVRAAAHNVPPGDYRVVAESLLSLPLELTAFVRAAVVPTIVPFSDACSTAVVVPQGGGFFQGTTANAADDFTAGCDFAGGSAPDQILQLTLSEPKRVVLDMSGSAYTTLLNVRQGVTCPGSGVLQGCAVGFSPSRSFLDLDLPAGAYWIQIDGYAGASGPWFLDIRVVDP